eukprot:TRINITY_DN17271_c0_g2_i3.p1 TRINITY_DN17271_c0_g2~~TRINITY_DN17271_c0_g2_i3.p1  ORF type:complete len:2830 (-),score=446.37 TRINITY_DN17271_c0_g2_i3:271-8760(-)
MLDPNQRFLFQCCTLMRSSSIARFQLRRWSCMEVWRMTSSSSTLLGLRDDRSQSQQSSSAWHIGSGGASFTSLYKLATSVWQPTSSTWYWHIAPCCGGTSVIYPVSMNRDVMALIAYVDRHACTKIESVTPGLVSAVLQLELELPKSLRLLASGGEALTLAACREFRQRFPQVDLWNNLALTETAADMAFCRITDEVTKMEQHFAPVSDGIVVWNHDVEILDEELCIRGWNVADGYMPPTTSERFELAPGGRQNRYRSGDRAAWVDGKLCMRGRMDSTVKVRGFRIDLAGLEAVMDECPAATDIAFIAFREAVWAAVVTSELETVKQFAMERFEHFHLIVWHVFDKLPYTASAKRDRKRIEVLLAEALASEDLPGGPPVGDMEVRVAAAWREVLGRDVGREEQWVHAGGHSLSAMKLASMLGLKPAEVYAFPTVAALAARLANVAAAGSVRNGVAQDSQQADNPQNSELTDKTVSVVGVSCRFPGAPSRRAFWEALKAGKDLMSDLPDASDAHIPRKGVVPDEGFDCAFWGLRPEAAAGMETAQRVLLEVAYEALEDAGFDPFNVPGRVGVVVCGGGLPYYGSEVLGVDLEEARVERPDEYFGLEIGTDKDYMATTVSYKLNLHGPSEVVQTACSSSLVAVVRAMQMLRLNLCDYVLCGGSSFSPDTAVRKVDGMIWSADGVCRPFADNANGTVNSDGCGLVLLTRTEAALQRGDWIYATIMGGATNNDGSRKAGFSAPSHEGQVEVIKMAMNDAGVTGDDIDYVEAHGTGTKLGDPLEVLALSDALQTSREVLLGSVKGNVGHLNTVAGMPGLIKVIEMMWRREIVPSLYSDVPNSFIDWQRTPLRMASYAGKWNGKVAGLSSFGIGGTNAHVILGLSPVQDENLQPPRAANLFVGSAHSPAALRSWAETLEEAAADLQPTRVESTLLRRKRFAHRCFALSACDLKTAPIVESRRPVVLLFPGQGAAYDGMGSHLEKDGLIHRNWQGVEPVDVVKASLMVAAALKRQGLEVQAVLGHSVGEWAAAAFAGVVSFPDAIRLAKLRGDLMKQMERGVMLSVRATAAEVKGLLCEGVEVACYNGAQSQVLAGPEAAMETMKATLDKHGFSWKRVSVDHAFHTAAVEPILPKYLQALESVAFSASSLPFLSNVTGGWHGDEITTATYWAEHLRKPVRFMENLSHLVQRFPQCVVVEVGPTALAGIVSRESRGLGADWKVEATMRQRDEVETYLRCLGTLWAYADINPKLPVGSTALVPLPSYSFQRVPLAQGKRSSARKQSKANSSARADAAAVSRPKFANGVFYETTYERTEVSCLDITEAVVVLDGDNLPVGIPSNAVVAKLERAVAAASASGCLIFVGSSDVEPGLDDVSQEQLLADVVKLLDMLTKAKTRLELFFFLKSGSLRYAGLLGLLRSAAREHPELRLRRLMWEDGAPFLFPVLPVELHLRADGGAYAPRLRAVPAPAPATSIEPVRPGSPDGGACRALVTGGLRGVGARVAEWLVATRRATSLVLVGRNAPVGDAAARLRDLEAKVPVDIRLCDVSNWAEVQQLPDCDLVLHVAGNVKDGLLVHASSADVQQVLRPKVRGSLHLKERFPAARFLAFSSTSGTFGSAAQASYAFANLFLDSVMPSIRWNGWAEVGMVEDLGISPLPGERFMPVDESCECLGQVLDGPERQEPLCVIDCDWETFRQNPTQFWPEDPLLAMVEAHQFKSLMGLESKVSDHVVTWDMVVGSAGARHCGTHAAWEVCQQHVVGTSPIFPATAFVALALEAARELFDSSSNLQLSNIAFLRPLELASARRLTTLFVRNTEGQGGNLRFSSRPLEGGSETLHCTCNVAPTSSDPKVFPVSSSYESMDVVNGFYECFNKAGFHYGPEFRTFDSRCDGTYAHCRLPSSRTSSFLMHPATLDAALHPSSLLHPLGCRGVPHRFQRLTVRSAPGETPPKAVDSCVRRVEGADGSVNFDVQLKDASGSVVCYVEGLELAIMDAPPSLQLRRRVLKPAVKGARRGLWLARDETVLKLGLPQVTSCEKSQYEAEVIAVSAESLQDVLRCRQDAKQAVARAPCWVVALDAPFAKAAAAAALEVGAQVLLGSRDEVVRAAGDIPSDAKVVEVSQGLVRVESLEPVSTVEPVRVSCNDAFSVVTDPSRGAKGATCYMSERKSPGIGEVELRASVWALNFRDVLVAVGAIPTEVAGKSLGIGGECYGEVVRVGPGKSNFAVGDKVIAVPPDGMGSYVTVDERWVAVAPATSPAEAVAGTCAYATAWLGLHWLARIGDEDRVLIHSAAGGVGLCAVHLCLRKGCTVYATASTVEKRNFLLRMGVKGVFDSRNPHAFEQGILDATAGEGIDVVLNSLSGEAIPASLRLLRPFGRFIEIGKRDQYEGTSMDLSPFLGGLTYAAAHLDVLMLRYPDRCRRLLEEVWKEMPSLPKLPTKSFGIGELSDALEYFSKGVHIGKVLVTIEETKAYPARPMSVAGPALDAVSQTLRAGLSAADGLSGVLCVPTLDDLKSQEDLLQARVVLTASRAVAEIAETLNPKSLCVELPRWEPVGSINEWLCLQHGHFVAVEEEQAGNLQEWLLDVVREMAGSIGMEQTFESAGLDSLALISLARRISTKLGRAVSVVDLYDHPTPQRLLNSLDGAPQPLLARPKILCLHGFRSNSEAMQLSLAPYVSAIGMFDWIFVNSPRRATGPSAPGILAEEAFEWWGAKGEPYETGWIDPEYDGLEETLSSISALGPVGVVGFSQGGAMASLLDTSWLVLFSPVLPRQNKERTTPCFLAWDPQEEFVGQCIELSSYFPNRELYEHDQGHVVPHSAKLVERFSSFVAAQGEP